MTTRLLDTARHPKADDEISGDSPLREIYDDASFQTFLCGVLGIDVHGVGDAVRTTS